MNIRKFEVTLAIPDDENSYISSDKILEELRASDYLESCAIEMYEIKKIAEKEVAVKI